MAMGARRGWSQRTGRRRRVLTRRPEASAGLQRPAPEERVAARSLLWAAECAGGGEFTHLAGAVARRLADAVRGGCMVLLCRHFNFVPIAVEHVRPEPRAWLRWLGIRDQAGLTSAFTRRLLQTGEPVFMPAVSSATLRLWAHPAFDGYLERFAVTSVLLVPIGVLGRVAGIVSVWREAPCAPFDDVDVALLEDIAWALGQHL